MKLDYTVVGTPKAQARPRFFRSKTGYMGTYSPKTDWFNIVYNQTLQQKETILKGQQLTGALRIELFFCMPIPKSVSQKKRYEMYSKYMAKKPDIDNLIKAVLDAINYTNLWEDDSHIAHIEAKKVYVTEPGCRIVITEIGAK